MTLEMLLRWVVVPVVQIALVLGVVLFCVAYLTLLERKVIAYMQVRLGPRRVGPHGLFQPIADVLKLMIKEDIVPQKVDRLVYWLAPCIALAPAVVAFAVIPFSGQPVAFDIFGQRIVLTPWVTDVNIGLLYLLAVSSLGVFGIVLGGWASNSKYPMLGGLRSAAQMISYEVPLGFSVVGVLMLAGTASMVGIVHAQQERGWWFMFPQIVGMLLYFVAGVAETNRAPFDLPEAENELVAGFHTEYSGMKFALFFLAEYMNMILVASIVTTLFLGGWLPVTFCLGYIWPAVPEYLANPLAAWPFHFTGSLWPAVTGLAWFGLKAFLVVFVYLWLRATFPRYRYDQLMRIGWKWLIPVAIANVMVTALVLVLW